MSLSLQWLVVVGSLAAFAFGWGTGSNDVANAFGTSVGSKALTLKQAVCVRTSPDISRPCRPPCTSDLHAADAPVPDL